MVKLALLILTFLCGIANADVVSPTFRRDKILFQFHYNDPGLTSIDTSTHGFRWVPGGAGTASITGKTGLAWSFNGSGYIPTTIGTSAPENKIGDFSIVVSFRPRGSSSPRNNIMGQSGTADNGWFFALIGHKLTMNWDGPADDAVPTLTGPMVSSSTWHHAIYWRKMGVVKGLDLDGVIVASNTTQNNTNNLDQEMDIGTNIAGTNCNFIGDIDEITVYQHCLSDGERKELYTRWVGRRKSFLE